MKNDNNKDAVSPSVPLICSTAAEDNAKRENQMMFYLRIRQINLMRDVPKLRKELEILEMELNLLNSWFK